MIHEGRPIGVVSVSRGSRGPFSDRQITLLQTFADQAVIAIENVRLFKELEARNRDLTATSKILQVISSSPTDVQPVFDSIVESAARLCDGAFSSLHTFDGELMHLVAAHNWTPAAFEAARRIGPARPGQATVTGRAIVECTAIHVPDTEQVDRQYQTQTEGLVAAIGLRSALAVPMLRDGVPLGVIGVSRAEPGLFSDNQIALLKTFADQAVIAIENVRLFKELQEKNGALTTAHTQVSEALEQQTATSEILSVISTSPTDVQPVFDAIVRSGVTLCGAVLGAVFRLEDDLVHLVGIQHPTPEVVAALYPAPLTAPLPPCRALRDNAITQVPDTEAEGALTLEGRQVARFSGLRSMLIVPMRREGRPIGAILVARLAVGRFVDKQIALLQTFADQAVIAIENVRLFKELQSRNSALSEALERQTATSEILSVISSSPNDVQPVFDVIARSAATLCNALFASVNRFDGELLHHVADYNLPAETLKLISQNYPKRPDRTGTGSRAVLTRAVVHIPDILEDPEYQRDLAVTGGWRGMLSVPMLRGTDPIGSITIAKAEPNLFTDTQVALLQTFADQAVIAIENVRLFKELEARNRDLTTALAQQTATSEILRVISSSPTDVQPVFGAIADSAMRLFGAWSVLVFRYDGDYLSLAAARGGLAGSQELLIEQYPTRRPSAELPPGQVILTRAVHHCVDTETDSTYPAIREYARMRGYRSFIQVPMLRGNDVLGVVSVTRTRPGAFAVAEAALLQTFADQAVIAIENVRLFKELEARTQDLTRSVGELRALGEVGQAISSTLDLRTVLSTIVARATQLSRTDAGVIYEYDERRELFEPRATERLEEDIVQALVATPIRKGEGATGKLADVREPIQVSDVRDIAQAFQAREVLVRTGYRAALAVPLMREDRLLGGLTVFRKTPGEFAPEVIDLLRTFATQSALAIQNARLFREIEVKSRELAAASQHKSEFLANMSHELRTPLNAIIGFSEVLSEKMFGELNEKQEEYSKDIHASGQHLLSLINDILDLSKIEAGRMELELTDFHLPTALDSALTLVRERAGRRGITLQMNVDSRLGQTQADERKVRQVVLNLLSNAIKFTPEGGRIEVAAAPKDGLVEISVSDTGVGIAREDQEAVFEEFRQVGTADKKVEGTGLGLTLCRKFVELHGGRIWVKSELGVGSTFTFTLPVRST